MKTMTQVMANGPSKESHSQFSKWNVSKEDSVIPHQATSCPNSRGFRVVAQSPVVGAMSIDEIEKHSPDSKFPILTASA